MIHDLILGTLAWLILGSAAVWLWILAAWFCRRFGRRFFTDERDSLDE